MKLVLFDVDGTLMSTRGAGMKAFYRALKHIFDVDVNEEVIRPDGKTDPLILKELLAYFNLEDKWQDKTANDLFSSYLAYLEEEIGHAREEGQVKVLPGVVELLQRLSGQPDFCVGLVTGNLEKGAYIKLENAGLNGYFRFGGYGSDSEDRTVLTRIGIRRGTQLVAPQTVENSFVIGDTPLDILHGHAAGADVIAVASAKYSMEELQAESPDLLIPDLTPVEKIICFMRGRQGRNA
jgi:phosphoglycolate phosphatase